MRELYNGYEINVAWNSKDFGYQFSIYDKDGNQVTQSIDPYFYEENALQAAKVAVNTIEEGG